MKFTRERRIQLVHDLPHWYDRPEIDWEALRRLALKDRSRACVAEARKAQAVVVEEKR